MRGLRDDAEEREGTNPQDEDMTDAQVESGVLSTPEDDTQGTQQHSAVEPHASRTGTGEPGLDEAAEADLTIEERHAFFMEQVKRKRIETEIVLLQQELAGDTPAEYVMIAGTSLPYRKRAASSNPEPVLLKQIKLGTPPSFSGKSVKEL
jgi:hypothetical protein